MKALNNLGNLQIKYYLILLFDNIAIIVIINLKKLKFPKFAMFHLVFFLQLTPCLHYAVFTIRLKKTITLYVYT